MTDRQSVLFEGIKMARIIDKEKKKREIALAALPVFAEEGFSSVSVARIAKAAGVGKGTIYLYFASKDEVVLEIWSYLREQHFMHIDKLKGLKSSEEKIMSFFDFGLFVEEEELFKMLKLFFDYLGSILLSDNEKFTEHFKMICDEDFKYIHTYITEGIKVDEFKDVDAELMVYTLLNTVTGSIVESKGMGHNSIQTNKKIVVKISHLLTLIRKEK